LDQKTPIGIIQQQKGLVDVLADRLGDQGVLGVGGIALRQLFALPLLAGSTADQIDAAGIGSAGEEADYRPMHRMQVSGQFDEGILSSILHVLRIAEIAAANGINDRAIRLKVLLVKPVVARSLRSRKIIVGHAQAPHL